jgi:hypothetical protein
MSSKIAFLHIFNLPLAMPLKDENFWKLPNILYDSVQFVRYDSRRKFDTDWKIIGISAIFKYNNTIVVLRHKRLKEKTEANISWNSPLKVQ